MCVRWGGSVSSKFTVSNGVRQGGILSPFLFNVYMDDLSVNLKKCPTGCIAGGTVVNHLMYAGDIVGEDGASWRTGKDDESALV